MEAQHAKQIDHYIFDKQSVLGKGAYSTVYLGYDKNDDFQPCAIKEQFAPISKTA